MTPSATPRRLLEEAISQRSRCYLSLPEPVVGLREVDCAILEASTRGLLLESIGKAAAGPHWVGQPVQGYFRVVLRRAALEETFYTFDSHITAAASSPAGLARLRLAEPESLVFGQRRKSLRLKPDSDRLRTAYFWPYERKTGFAMDAPALRSGDFHSGAARLDNLSAGGLCLALRAALARTRGLEPAKGQRLVIRLELHEPRATDVGEFWIVAKISHVSQDRVGQDMTIGLEFLASGSLDAKAGKIRWQPVESHVIPGLADILYLWHLDRHRDRQS
ncbi:PilZ domain-containing protein [Solidesulfovibrio sp.]